MVRVCHLTSRLFTTCRSRAKHGAGMSAPFLIYTFHRLRGKRRVSAALREMTCYLMLRAAPSSWHSETVAARETVAVVGSVLSGPKRVRARACALQSVLHARAAHSGPPLASATHFPGGTGIRSIR